MSNLPEGYMQIHPTTKDAAKVLALIEVCESAEYGSPDTDADSLQEDWFGVDLEKDAILLHDESGRLVGYAVSAGSGDHYQVDFFPHPNCDWNDIGDYLLEYGLSRVHAHVSGAQVGEATVRSYAAHANNDKLKTLEKRGFRPERYHLQMQIEFESPPVRASFPGQLSLRTFQPEQDAQTVYALMKAAFERPNRSFPDFQDWQAFMIESPQFDPELWFLLEQDHTLVGASLCYDYPSYGWVRQLGVLPEWRGRGLGKKLLLYSFENFHKRGRTKVALGVAAENANAQALYERAGMQIARQYDEYTLRMGA